MQEVKGVRWFNGRSCVGIVWVKDPYDGDKFYVGAVAGRDEQADIESIAAWGSRFDDAAGRILFGVEG